MQKIFNLFQRETDGKRRIFDAIEKGSDWVTKGEGTPTRKWDGTCVLIRDGKLFKRYEVKKGKQPPAGFEPACEVDPITGKQQGWLAVGDGPEDKWHREAFDLGISDKGEHLSDGTYELCGPKIQSNPERFISHLLVRHGCDILADVPHSFEGLREYFMGRDIEGIVWHHPDGRTVKIRGCDFGIKRPEPTISLGIPADEG